MNLFTKYTVVTDGEKWALKRTFLWVFVSAIYFSHGQFHHWNFIENPSCWTDEATARRELRRRTV